MRVFTFMCHKVGWKGRTEGFDVGGEVRERYKRERGKENERVIARHAYRG